MDGFAAYIRRRYAPGTIKHYLREVELYRHDHGDNIDQDTLRKWRRELSGSPATKNRKIAAIKAWARYRRQPIALQSFKARVRARRVPDVSAIDRAPGDGGLFLRLLFSTGLRVSEGLGLRRGDVRDDCLLINGKGSKQRLVPVSDELRRSLLMLGRERLFPYSYGWARKQADMAGVRPHDLRHAFATELHEAGANLIAIRDLLGHSSTKTTSIYTHPSMKMLQESRDLLGR